MITKYQRIILAAIEKDPTRTLKEMALAVNLSSESNVYNHIKILIKNGYLKADGRTLIEQTSYNNVLEKDQLALEYSKIELEFAMNSGEIYCLNDLARRSYEMAEAMLKEKLKREETND